MKEVTRPSLRGNYRWWSTLVISLALVAAACGSDETALSETAAADEAADVVEESIDQDTEPEIDDSDDDTDASDDDAETVDTVPSDETPDGEAEASDDEPEAEAEGPTVFDVIVDHPETGGFQNAVFALEIPFRLSLAGDDGPFTVLAPSGENFLDGIAPIMVLDTEPQRSTFQYHFVLGEVAASEFVPGASFETLAGETLVVGSDGTLPGGFSIGESDIEASNGLIHIIDGVLTPPSVEPLLVE